MVDKKVLQTLNKTMTHQLHYPPPHCHQHPCQLHVQFCQLLEHQSYHVQKKAKVDMSQEGDKILIKSLEVIQANAHEQRF